jgi:hypothetical protein
MEHLEVFLTVSEVAAAFAALSLLVTALRVSDRDDVYRHLMLRDVAQSGLIVIGAALGAFALLTFDFGASFTWRLASAGLIVANLLARRSTISKVEAVDPDISHPVHLTGRFFPHFNIILVIVMMTLLAWNVVAPGPQAEARYLLAILLLLCHSGVLFISAAFVMPTQGGDA